MSLNQNLILSLQRKRLVGYCSDSFSGLIIFQQASTKARTAQKPVKSKEPVSKAKPKTTSKKKVLVDHNENADRLMDETEEGDASDNDQFGGASSGNLQAVAKKKTVSETYTKVVYSPLDLV